MVPEYIRHVPPRMYAKACVYGDLIFLAGEDGKDEATEEVVGDTAAQTEKTFFNMKATLESLGSGLEHSSRPRSISRIRATVTPMGRSVASTCRTCRRAP